MATQIQTVETLPLICWKSQPVITTELLAAVYEVQEKQIRQNFNNNASRFVEGIHHYKLTGSELKEFKNCIENFEAVRIAREPPI